jgi:uncharacterized protein
MQVDPCQTRGAPRVLVLPGWHGGDPAHWSRRWAHLHAHLVVEQNDWVRPKRGDWLARLDEVVIDTTANQVVLVAHGLACAQVAAWVALSRHTARVTGALLIDPLDLETPTAREQLPGWGSLVRQKFPFPSILLVSQGQHACRAEVSQVLAQDWGSERVDLAEEGPVHAESQQTDWLANDTLLNRFLIRLMKES